MPTKKTLLFIPTYNEGTNVEPLCARILALRLEADVLFLDDSSPDGTGEVLDRLAREHGIQVIHRTQKAGIGSAHYAGISYAYDHGYARLVTLDADLTHPPEAIPDLLARAADADVVIGSRFADDTGFEGWTLLRRSLSSVGHALTQNLLGMAADATGAFRVYDLEKIPRELFDLVTSRGYSFFFESLFMLQQNGFRIAEVPVRTQTRSEGVSKMTPFEVAYSVKMLAKIYGAKRSAPERFRIQPPPELDAALIGGHNWNAYWDDKSGSSSALYELIAYVYRNGVNKPRLHGAIRHEFPKGARLLHAGCGSGQVDVGLHEWAEITAADISESALRVYLRENPGAHVKHADILNLPFADGTFDGVYNMGVVEHLEKDELLRALAEMRRVLKPGGKAVIFWPHAHATSVAVIKVAHWMLNDVMNRNIHFHPPEVSLVHSRGEAEAILASANLDMASYSFGPRDFFVQALVVAQRPA